MAVTNAVVYSSANLLGVANIAGNPLANRIVPVPALLLIIGVALSIIFCTTFGAGALNFASVAGIWHIIGSIDRLEFPAFEVQVLDGLVQGKVLRGWSLDLRKSRAAEQDDCENE